MSSYLSNGMVAKHCCSAAFCQLVRGENRAPFLTGRHTFGYQLCCVTRCTFVRCHLLRGRERNGRDIISRVYIFSISQRTPNIAAIKVCQFQHDHDEQARCEFKFVLSLNTLTVVYFYASAALSTADRVSMNVCQIQRDRDEQARRDFEFVLSISTRQYHSECQLLAINSVCLRHRKGCPQYYSSGSCSHKHRRFRNHDQSSFDLGRNGNRHGLAAWLPSTSPRASIIGFAHGSTQHRRGNAQQHPAQTRVQRRWVDYVPPQPTRLSFAHR